MKLLNIKCVKCEKLLTVKNMMKQSIEDTKKRMIDPLNYIPFGPLVNLIDGKPIIKPFTPECEHCGSNDFRCPECGMTTMEFKKNGEIIHGCVFNKKK